MQRIHAFLIAAAVAFAVVAGAFAAFRTTRLGVSSRQHVSPAVLAAQNRALDRTEAALRHSLHAPMPKLPTIPRVHAVPRVLPARPAPAVTTQAPRTTTKSSPAGRRDDGEQDGIGRDD